MLIFLMFTGMFLGVLVKVRKLNIVRLVFGCAWANSNIPTDTSYLIWLYGLAKPRVWIISKFPGKTRVD